MNNITNNPNTWLTSNSQLYFADSILTKDLPLNAYSIFDLSNLLEAILLADNIITLPGNGFENQTAKKLRKENLLRQLEIEKDIADMISYLKSTWDSDSITYENKEKIANIMCDVFPIEKEVAYNAISNANIWANEVYRTPSWHRGKEFTMETVLRDGLSLNMVHTDNMDFFFTRYKDAHPKVIEEMVSETYVRAIFYLMIASSRKLNYYPDSIRIPITAYLNSYIEQTAIVHVKQLISQIQDKIDDEVKKIYENHGFSRFEIIVPSSFNTVLKNCKSKDELIEKALELRYEKDVTQFRKWLSELEEATKNMNIKKIREMLNQEKTALNPKKYDLESLIVNSIPSLSDIASTNYLLVLKSVDKGVSIAAEKLLERYKTRNITYLRNLAMQFEKVISIHQDMERIFGSKLSDKNIEIFGSLRAYQRDYLFKLTQQPKEKENVPKVRRTINRNQMKLLKMHLPLSITHHIQ